MNEWMIFDILICNIISFCHHDRFFFFVGFLNSLNCFFLNHNHQQQTHHNNKVLNYKNLYLYLYLFLFFFSCLPAHHHHHNDVDDYIKKKYWWLFIKYKKNEMKFTNSSRHNHLAIIYVKKREITVFVKFSATTN